MTTTPAGRFKRILKDPRAPVGYIDGDRLRPIYNAMPGTIVTQALILCCQCMRVVRSNGGMMSSAWCVACTEKKEQGL